MDEMLKKQDVLDAIYEKMEKTDKPDVILGLAAAMSTVKQMQAALVNPAEKVGYWIDHQEDRWIYAKCSECETVHDSRTNYCPHCGAKMQEVE